MEMNNVTFEMNNVTLIYVSETEFQIETVPKSRKKKLNFRSDFHHYF